jgi:outer membrane protein assembly factor BamB
MRHPPLAMTSYDALWRRLVIATLLCAVLTVAVSACEHGATTTGLASADSLIYSVNTNSGSLVTAVSSTTGNMLWQTLVAGYVNGDPISVGDVIYTCSYGYGPAPAPPTLTALRRRDGHELWRTTQPHCGGSGVLGVSTTALAVNADGTFSVLNPSDGSVRWSKTLMAAAGRPVIGHDAVYTLMEREPRSGSNHLSVYAFALRDGTALWQVPFSTVNTRLFATDHALYGNPDVHTARAVNAEDGRAVWTNTVEGEVIAATDQMVLAVEAVDVPSHRLIAMDPEDGHVLWRASVDISADWPTGAVLMSGDGLTVFHENDVTQLRASDGGQLWSVPIDDQHYVSPVFANASTVFALVTRRPYQSLICFSACGQRLVALDASTGATRWQKDL